MEETRTCKACHVEQPIENFAWRNKAKNLRRRQCKSCEQAVIAARIAARPAVNAEAFRTCTQCHVAQPMHEFSKNATNADGLSWWCKCCVHEKNEAYRSQHLEELRVKEAAYSVANRLERNAAAIARYAKERDTICERRRESYAANPEKYRAEAKTWRKDNPGVYKASQSRRRASKKNAPINDLSAEQWEEILIAFSYRCAYCHRKMKNLTKDHVTPYAKNGSHTLWNVVPACPSCNSKKRDKDVLSPVQPLLLTLASPKPKKKP